MAEPEQEAGIGQEVRLPTTVADDQRGSIGIEETVGYWCYQCNKEVAVDAEEEVVEGELAGGMFCTECRGGFIEAMATVRPDLHGTALRRRTRAALAPHRSRIAFLLENVYPQQFMHVLQALDQVTPRPNSTEQRDHSSGNQNENMSTQADQNNSAVSVLERSDVEEEGSMESVHPRVVDLETVDSRVVERQERVSRESSVEPDGQDEDGEGASGDPDSEEEEASFEYGGWGSATDEDGEEWEEVEDEEGEVHDEAEETGSLGFEVAVTEAAPVDNAEDEPSVFDEHGDIFTGGRNFQGNLHRYLQNFLQSLSDPDVQVLLELPDGPSYVGNPGDYLDSRGFHNFIQQLAENDNSCRGAPPAAKIAVDNLSVIQIEKHHVEDGMGSCSICKDVFGLGDAAKQLPCLHLYHHDCIITWLSSRNSCPMCRYELPTDDPDYESQKQREVRFLQTYEPSGAAEEQLGGEERLIPLQSEVVNSPETVQMSVSFPSLTPEYFIPSTSSQTCPDHIQKL